MPPTHMHSRLRLRAPLALAGVGGAAACSSASPTAPNPCSAPVTLTIGAGERPTFSWVPACRVALFAVTDTTGRVVWQRGTGDRNDIASPVRYPDAALDPATGSAAPLVAGRRYGVLLWRTVPRPALCLAFLGVCGVSIVADTVFVR